MGQAYAFLGGHGLAAASHIDYSWRVVPALVMQNESDEPRDIIHVHKLEPAAQVTRSIGNQQRKPGSALA